jgi:hypothetical protein
VVKLFRAGLKEIGESLRHDLALAANRHFVNRRGDALKPLRICERLFRETADVAQFEGQMTARDSEAAVISRR